MEWDIERMISEMTLEEKAQMCSGRDVWNTQNIDRLGIPSVMMSDGPNGLRKQLGKADNLGLNESIETVCYPTSSATASSFDTDLLTELGGILGDECKAEHIAMLLGPGINMKRSPLCGRNFEYFSEDPYLAGKLAAAYIRGLQGKGVAACVKHFAANDQETRRMSGSSEVEERTLNEIYLPAFEAAVKEGGVRSVMCAYNALNGTFCAENRELLTDILRKKWGFGGFVVTDWGASKDRPTGLKAGVDLEMPGSTEGKTESIINAVKEGRLPENCVDDAVRHVLAFVKEALDHQQEEASFDRENARVKSGEFETRCAVLLKNNGILPLKKDKKIAVIGEFAENVRCQGAGSSHIHTRRPLSFMDCAEGLCTAYARGYDAHKEERDEKLENEAVITAASCDAAVIFAGIPESFEVEGCDREHMRMPENQNSLIRTVAKAQKNTIVVLHTGAPLELPWEKEVSAVLCMYLGGESVGKAEKELLFGEKNPSGKLAETWPLKLEDNSSFLNFPGENGKVKYKEGVFIGYRYYDKKKMEVRYPFGYGLSYTSFEYRLLKLSRNAVGDGDILKVTCKVLNTGKTEGEEIIQLYVGQKESPVMRPVRELKGFCKLRLAPGEEKEAEFILDSRSFSYYEERIHDWYANSGEYRIEIGASSRDIRLSAGIRYQADKELPVHFTKYSTIGELLQTEKGRAYMKVLKTRMGGDPAPAEGEIKEDEEESNGGEESTNALGEGADRADAAALGMPLYSFHTFGFMSEEEVEALVASLNEKNV
ncbi:MAG TPA: glycoside hydrolase family 3 C-terminal domain-containing protein [Lachnospiraceae bacterium]|nr:glycoside hydrolase family 3 C-terminal domain-containing protein [Lachnospiraceae bacterium]